jgi:HSP20 family molecular chaperone IbpA
MTGMNDFFGLKINPVDLLASVLDEALTKQSDAANAGSRGYYEALKKQGAAPRDFDIKSHIDNFASMGQGLFESFNVPGLFDEKKDVSGFTPAVDVLVSEANVTYFVGVPGVQQEDVVVELEDEKLTISINSGTIIASDEVTHNWKGGEWSKSFNIPTGTVESPKKIDEENISANVEDGLITVVVFYKAPKVTKIKVG